MRITLTAPEREELEGAARRQRRVRDWRRYQALVLLMTRDSEEVAAGLGCSRASVYRWAGLYRSRGPDDSPLPAPSGLALEGPEVRVRASRSGVCRKQGAVTERAAEILTAGGSVWFASRSPDDFRRYAGLASTKFAWLLTSAVAKGAAVSYSTAPRS